MLNLFQKRPIGPSIREKAIAVVHHLGEPFDHTCDDDLGYNHGAVGYYFKSPDLTITLFERKRPSSCIIKNGCYELTPSNEYKDVHISNSPLSLLEKIDFGKEIVRLYVPGKWERRLDFLYNQVSFQK